MSSSDSIVKPLTAGAVATLLDIYYLKNGNMQSAMIFGATVAGSTFASDMVSKNIPSVVGNKYKSLQQRVIEVSLSTGFGYFVDRYICWKNDYNPSNFMHFAGKYIYVRLIFHLSSCCILH
jgi:hypothetical protein